MTIKFTIKQSIQNDDKKKNKRLTKLISVLQLVNRLTYLEMHQSPIIYKHYLIGFPLTSVLLFN